MSRVIEVGDEIIVKTSCCFRAKVVDPNIMEGYVYKVVWLEGPAEGHEEEISVRRVVSKKRPKYGGRKKKIA